MGRDVMDGYVIIGSKDLCFQAVVIISFWISPQLTVETPTSPSQSSTFLTMSTTLTDRTPIHRNCSHSTARIRLVAIPIRIKNPILLRHLEKITLRHSIANPDSPVSTAMEWMIGRLMIVRRLSR